MIAIWANVSTDRREWLTTEYKWKSILFFRRFFCFMNPEVALEIFGYIGTALVLTSFIMKDIKWLRVVNISGSVISCIYALLMHTLPVAVLNGSLIMINSIQLARILREEKIKRESVNN